MNNYATRLRDIVKALPGLYARQVEFNRKFDVDDLPKEFYDLTQEINGLEEEQWELLDVLERRG